MLESVYEEWRRYELGLRGVPVQQQVSVPVRYKGRGPSGQLRMDLIVDDRLVVEVKSLEHTLPVHEAQLLTYLRLSGLQVGLIINFGQPRLHDGIKRLSL